MLFTCRRRHLPPFILCEVSARASVPGITARVTFKWEQHPSYTLSLDRAYPCYASSNASIHQSTLGATRTIRAVLHCLVA